MSANTYTTKSMTPGYCRKCGKTFQVKTPALTGMETTTGCMITAEQHVKELQRDLAKNTSYCEECSAKIADNMLLNIIFFPFTIIKAVVKLFTR